MTIYSDRVEFCICSSGNWMNCLVIPTNVEEKVADLKNFKGNNSKIIEE